MVYPRKADLVKCLIQLQLALQQCEKLAGHDLTQASSQLERVMCLHFQIQEPVQSLGIPEKEEKLKADFTKWLQTEQLKSRTAELSKQVGQLRNKVLTALDQHLVGHVASLKEVALGCADGTSWKAKLDEGLAWPDVKKVATATLLTDTMCKALTSRFRTLKKEPRV